MVRCGAALALLLLKAAGASPSTTTFCENCKSEGGPPTHPDLVDLGGAVGLAEFKPSATVTAVGGPLAADLGAPLGLVESKPSTTICENCKSEASLGAPDAAAGGLLKADLGGSLGLAESKPTTTFCENCKSDASLGAALTVTGVPLEADLGSPLALAESVPTTTFCENCKSDGSAWLGMEKGQLARLVGLAGGSDGNLHGVAGAAGHARSWAAGAWLPAVAGLFALAAFVVRVLNRSSPGILSEEERQSLVDV
mmetsp:Transcript_80937/g.182610  ORF Transcript_80937/g.182610 Transcript_80937/m.182610 type:complete len:254 (-) Transcript_80937:76-837(-)